MRDPEFKWSLYVLEQVDYLSKTNNLILTFTNGDKVEFSHANELETYDYQVKSLILVCHYKRSFAPNKWFLGGICQAEGINGKGVLYGITKITNASHTQYDKPFILPTESDKIEDCRF